MIPSNSILCPSSRCEDGAVLLGVVSADGRVAFAQDLIVIDKEFVRVAHEGRSPEKRFRFGSPCARGACHQWTGERCGVIDKVMETIEPSAAHPELPECAIRSQCRWFGQSGEMACGACPEVITDLRDTPEVTHVAGQSDKTRQAGKHEARNT